jgi:peptide/nickel transport system permease protein
VVSAVRRGGVIDTVAKGIALLGQAVPAFYLSILLILLFAVQLPWFPVAGRDGAASYVLPALALGWPALSGVLRLTRSSMLDALDADYVRMARAKGMHPSITVGKHALRNALIPVVTFSGLMLAGFLGGAVVIESIFNWQGVGQLTLDAIKVRDFPVVQGAVITVAIGFIVVNLLVDILYLVIDPRIRYE